VIFLADKHGLARRLAAIAATQKDRLSGARALGCISSNEQRQGLIRLLGAGEGDLARVGARAVPAREIVQGVDLTPGLPPTPRLARKCAQREGLSQIPGECSRGQLIQDERFDLDHSQGNAYAAGVSPSPGS